MIDTTNLKSLSVEELRAGIVLQRKEIDRLREEIKQVAEYNEGLTTRCIEDTSRIAALEKQLASRGVPAEPTLDMVQSGLEVYGLEDCAEADVRAIYNAMLAAAPSPEGQEAATIDPEKLRVALEQAGMRLIQMEGGRLSLEKATPIYARPTHPAPAERQAGEREAFEQAAEAMGFDLSEHWGQPGNNFESDDTRLAYEIWQKAWRAALAAQQQEGRE